MRVLALLLLTACGPRAVMRGREMQAQMPGAEREVAATPIRGGELMSEEPVEGVVISRLPAPHRERAVAMTPATVETARAMVGHRDPRSGVAFAIDVARALRGIGDGPVVESVDALVASSEDVVALVAGTGHVELASGDVIVFERVEMAAVVLGTDERGVTDLIYVGRGVVRRGYMDLTRPAMARDKEGRVVNSFVRHGSEQPPAGTRFLAGELASKRLRIR